MNRYEKKPKENKSQIVSTSVRNIQSEGESTYQFVDKRPEADIQRKLQDKANKSQQVLQYKAFEQMPKHSPKAEEAANFGLDVKSNFIQEDQPIQKKENKTGLPDDLKSGMEDLSGISLNDVKVHRNSDRPAQFQADAYAQGTDIHISPGHERELPHEAWHVVQQKQGRVKPTKQLMSQGATPSTAKENAVNINDDAGLEQEADALGMKALDSPIQQESVLSDHVIGNTKTVQLQKSGKSSDTGSVSLVERSGANTVAAEKEVNPKSDAKRLATIKATGVDMGAGAQIKLQGELTMTARLNGFFGNESTYSKLLGKMEQFNKSKEVTQKQTLLKELKPLARTWLERHAKPESSDGKEDENEKLKRASIENFLNHTTSNYLEVIKKYEELQMTMESFIGNPINNRALFHRAVVDYELLTKLVETYKSKYPPSLNLLFLSEMDSIDTAETGLAKSGAKKGSSFDTGLGFSISDPEVHFNLVSGTYSLSGNLGMSLPGLVSANGAVTVEMNSDGSFSNIMVDGTSCKFVMDGIEFEMLKFSYDFKNNEFITEEASGSLNVLGSIVTLKVNGASIKNGITDYKGLEGAISGTIDTKMGIQVVNPTIRYLKGEAIEANGTLNLTIANLMNATGRVNLSVDNLNNIEDISLEDGTSEASIPGVNLKLNGITYTYSTQKFSVEEARGEVNIFGYPISLNVTGASVDKNNFNYEKIEGELPDVDYGFFSLKKTAVTYSKELKVFEGKTTYQFNTDESPVGFDNFRTGGDVEVHWNPEGDKYYAIDNGELKFRLLGQEVEAKNFSYNSKEQVINADELSLAVDMHDFKKTFTGKRIAINREGMSFEELKTEASGHEFNMRVFSLKPKKYALLKDEDGGLKVNAHGAMVLDLPNYLGLKSTGEIEGDVSLSLGKSLPEYHITSGTAELKMPNPLNKIGEILGDNWSSSRYELSAAIPIFPAVSAIFGIYMEYGGKFAEELEATIALDSTKNSLIIQAGTNITANVGGGVFGGIQGGSQLLIALALLLRASGNFDMNTEIKYAKVFPLEEAPSEGKIKEDSGFKYNIQGEAKVGASLDIVATALYFFQKQFSLSLGEKSLGEFEFSNTKNSNPDMGENALVNRETLDNQISPSHKEEAKTLTLEQLLDLDYNHRFSRSGKKEAIKVIKSAELGRESLNQMGDSDSTELVKFNNAALANLQFYNEFIDKRCNWTEIYEVLGTLGASIKSKEELETHADKGEKYLSEEILGGIKKMGSSSNIAEVFFQHYDDKVDIFKKSYPEGNISEYYTLLQKKGKVLRAVQNMKNKYLHSSFYGDESKQLANIKTGSFIRKSNYENFAVAYGKFREVMMEDRNVFDQVKTIGKQTAFKLVQDHQRRLENKTE
jgi:hypothetical protein